MEANKDVTNQTKQQKQQPQQPEHNQLKKQKQKQQDLNMESKQKMDKKELKQYNNNNENNENKEIKKIKENKKIRIANKKNIYCLMQIKMKIQKYNRYKIIDGSFNNLKKIIYFIVESKEDRGYFYPVILTQKIYIKWWTSNKC